MQDEEERIKVSMMYRRWLKELSDAAGESPEALARVLASVRIESDRVHTDLSAD